MKCTHFVRTRVPISCVSGVCVWGGGVRGVCVCVGGWGCVCGGG